MYTIIIITIIIIIIIISGRSHTAGERDLVANMSARHLLFLKKIVRTRPLQEGGSSCGFILFHGAPRINFMFFFSVDVKSTLKKNIKFIRAVAQDSHLDFHTAPRQRL